MRKYVFCYRFGLLILVFALLFTGTVFAQTTGKISGVIKDAQTGEPLPGANIVVLGTNFGAATDLEGVFHIVNIPVGQHDVQASMMGYERVKKTNVLVSLDRITNLDFELKATVIEGAEVTIVAEKEILHKEVSNSQQVITQDQFVEAAGVRTINDFLSKQAGITDEEFLGIRGGSPDQTGTMINGLTFVDASLGRAQATIPLSAVEQVSVLTGGFNAEYGNFRSGLINVVTKSGWSNAYHGQINYTMTSGTPKRFGKSAYDPNNWLLRSYFDPSVAFIGTNAAWADNPYMKEQFRSFGGWEGEAAKYNEGKPADQHVTPLDLYLASAWMFQTVPDFNALSRAGYSVPSNLQQALRDHANPGEGAGSDLQFDGGFGGPVPVIGNSLGNATFYLSNQTAKKYYVQPVVRDHEFNTLTMLTVKSNITENLSVKANGFYRKIEGVSPSRSAAGDTPSGDGRGGLMSINNLETWVDDGDTYWLYPTYYTALDVTTQMAGLTFNHVISPRTFWELTVSYLATDNASYPEDDRDLAVKARFGPISVTEMPYGRYSPESSYMVEDWEWNYYEQPPGVKERFGNKGGNLYDDSKERQFRIKWNFGSQVNTHNYIKAGLEYNLIHLDVFQWKERPAYINNTYEFAYNRKPKQFGAYLQDQLTFEGMVANIGVRLDYYDGGGGVWPNGDLFAQSAWEVRNSDTLMDMLPYRQSHIWQQLDAYAAENPGFYKEIENHLSISPRLGVSFPVTDRSKIYFNYGHFRSTVPYSKMFLNRYRNSSKNNLEELGNPNLEPPRTIAYELGVDYNLLDQYLIHIAGFYKDITGQHGNIRYRNTSGILNYRYRANNNYQDIQGLELTVTKQVGTWLSGWMNFRYMLVKSGVTGRSTITEENVDNAMEGLYQGDENRPRPIPEFTANIMLHAPSEWGPEVMGNHVLGDWDLSILPVWRKGDYFTWNPLGKLHLENNMNWPDYYMVDMRLSKMVRAMGTNLTFYVDVENIFNIKVSHLSDGYPFDGGSDRNAYLRSLHLPMYDSPEFDKLRELNPGLYIGGDDKVGDLRSDDKPYINDPNINFLMFGQKRQVWFGVKMDF
ncbi:TonB-dependent receptor [candidate division KSB1 bacterium]|nr:TonB-dependent receptor [candidate division KSB1 bacterium]